MEYRVNITERAERDLERTDTTIEADSSEQASIWFNGRERTIQSLNDHAARDALSRKAESFATFSGAMISLSRHLRDRREWPRRDRAAHSRWRT